MNIQEIIEKKEEDDSEFKTFTRIDINRVLEELENLNNIFDTTIGE